MVSKLTLTSTVKLSSGHTMPLLGFGVFQSDITKAAVSEAFKAGLLDSAQWYQNEAEVGDAVRESGLDRGEVFVTTKCMSHSHGYESTLKGVEQSLETMKFDYIDLFLIHDPKSGKEKRLATYKALLEAKASGQIRTVGVSNYNVKHLNEIREAGMELPSVNQIELHPLCQQKPIVEYCTKHNIIVQAYCPIVRGKLDDPVITDVAATYNRDPAQILLRWSLQKGFVPLPKSATPSRIRSNAMLYDFELGEEAMGKLDGLDKGGNGAVSWNPVEAD